MAKISEIQLLWRCYGCKNKEEFNAYKKNNEVMTINQLKETLYYLVKKNHLSAKEIKRALKI
jgi:hypothetical protein